MGVMDFFKKPEQRLLAAQYALRSTAFGGRNNVVRVELNPTTQAVEFIINATGERKKTVEEAFTAASTMMFTQFASIKPVSGSILNLGRLDSTGNIVNNNPTQNAAVGDILLTIQENLRNAAKNSDTLRQLESMGISQAVLSGEDLSVNLATIKNQRGVRPIDFFQRLRESGQGFIPIIDKDGATLMQFRIGEKVLTEAQTYFMLSVAGNPLLDDKKLMSTLAGGGPIEDYMSKLGKRIRGIVGDRDLTITMDTILRGR